MIPLAGQYEALVEAVDSAQTLVQQVEAEPPSPKRDAALEILREHLGDAIRLLGAVGSTFDRA